MLTQNELSEILNEHPAILEQRGVDGEWFGNKPLPNLISLPFIYFMIIPISWIDVSVQIYQHIYFGIFQIPKVDRGKYVVFDRAHLSRLNWLQRLNCVYCEYANGVFAWCKDVVAQTEIYSCAIKHWHPAYNQPHQTNYYSARLFDQDPQNDPPGKSAAEILAQSTTFLVVEDGKQIANPTDWELIPAGIAIFGTAIPIMFIDLCLQFYQWTYFSIHKIPKIPRSKYLVMDRWKLPKLTAHQRFSCFYCEYANGIAAWAKDIGAQTEIYSCAIKHWHPAYKQDHQTSFYDYVDFK